MKTNFCLIFLVIAYVYVCECDCKYEEDQYISNPDFNAKLERPCQVYDLNCIRHYFLKHSNCYIARGPIPDPLYKPQANYEVPRVNLSLVLVDQTTTGLNNGRIEEFYVNRNTRRLVLSVEFRQLGISSNNTYYIFNRRAKEPNVNVDFGSVLYQSIVITAVFPDAYNLQLEKAEITVYSNDMSPPFSIGPGAVMGNDPAAEAGVAGFFTDIPTNVQELFLGDGTFYLSSYIQYNICDFSAQAA